MRLPALVCAAVLAVSAAPARAQSPPPCDNCGTVKSVTMSSERSAGWQPLGTVAPGTFSGYGQPDQTTASLSIGRGGSNQGMVLLGAAGGAAYARRPGAQDRPRWDVLVQMDGGEARRISVGYDPLVQEGDRVRVYGTQIESM